MDVKTKAATYGLNVRTFQTKSERKTYLVFRTLEGSFHVFTEVEAKAAARDCGAIGEHNTRGLWTQLWTEEEAKDNAA